MIEFEWDERKHQLNISRHKISFVIAPKFFSDFFTSWIDIRKNYGEKRLVALGKVEDTILVTIYTIRKINVYRIISIRRANKNEREKYRTLQKKHEG